VDCDREDVRLVDLVVDPDLFERCLGGRLVDLVDPDLFERCLWRGTETLRVTLRVTLRAILQARRVDCDRDRGLERDREDGVRLVDLVDPDPFESCLGVRLVHLTVDLV